MFITNGCSVIYQWKLDNEIEQRVIEQKEKGVVGEIVEFQGCQYIKSSQWGGNYSFCHLGSCTNSIHDLRR
jgi:hypothetical protein